MQNEMEAGGIRGSVGVWGFPQMGGGLPCGGPKNKDSNIWASTFGSPYLGNYHAEIGVYGFHHSSITTVTSLILAGRKLAETLCCLCSDVPGA